uniref:Ribosomal protein eL8/eL30/eS12/Gadd45 domain-containing protein n=1 Tax=Poecilia mexicana TaxID=48701 RepID=A0A3B3XRL0_9TELE
MTSAGKPSKKDLKKHIQSKASFTSPFSSKWRPLLPKNKDFILRTLKDKIIATGEEAQGSNLTRNGWTDSAARWQLAIGINEVTKALERNQLQLLLVCKSVRPHLMTNHLIALSATRGVPACQVPRMSETVAAHLGLKSLLALGFRRCSSEDKEMFRDTVDAIKPRVPSLEVDWLTDEAAAVPVELTADLEEGEEQTEEAKEEEGGRRAQKRKLEIESEITDSALSCALRPLKVKRIVPNPAKKRTKLKKQK